MLPIKSKTLILVFVHHMMSVDVPWRNTPQTSTKARKTLVNQNLITTLQIHVEVKMWSRQNNSRRNWSRRNNSRWNNGRWNRSRQTSHLCIFNMAAILSGPSLHMAYYRTSWYSNSLYHGYIYLNHLYFMNSFLTLFHSTMEHWSYTWLHDSVQWLYGCTWLSLLPWLYLTKLDFTMIHSTWLYHGSIPQ